MMKISQWKDADRRGYHRNRLQLKLALIYPQRLDRPDRPMFHGKTCDISMSGLSIVVGYNIFQEGEVAVVLDLPPAYAGAPRKVVTATAEMTYAIYSSKLDAFKIGLAFRKFRGDGKVFLATALRHALKEEVIAGTQDPGGCLSELPSDA
ncbi:MAG: PilZ domain-containing protein [Pseudomonadota bacterium]